RSGGRLDLPGAACGVAALTGITYALTEAGRGVGTGAIVGGVIGVAAAIAFVLIEQRTVEPLVRLELFADRVFAATNLATVFVYAALAVYFFLLALQLQVVVGWSPLAAGTSLLPITAVMLLLSARFGALSER